VAIRLRLRLSRGGHSVDVVALVKSGYETVEPEILVPPVTARELHLYPELPYGAVVGEYRLADGSVTELIRILEDDRVVGSVESSLVIAEKAGEPLISDKLAGRLSSPRLRGGLVVF